MLTQANRRKHEKSDTESPSITEPEPAVVELPFLTTRTTTTLPSISMVLRPIATSTQLPVADADSQMTQLPTDFNEVQLVEDEVSDPDKTTELFVAPKPPPKKK